MSKPGDKGSAGPPTGAWIRAGTLEQLKAQGMTVLRGAACPLLVVHNQGSVYALDNRCPHLGFPLHRGSVEDGILTCHWHHARFDLCSGGTLAFWAGDVPDPAVEAGDARAGWGSLPSLYSHRDEHSRYLVRVGL